jgi:histidinol-phosphate aminotransferase
MSGRFNLESLVRENIKKLKPYSSARDEYKGHEGIFLDANENALGSTAEGGPNRYPDPLQWKLKERIGSIKKIDPKKIFLGNGSDEPIDLLFRAICNPGKDNVVTLPPTYGMYEVAAGTNDVKVKEVLLTEDFQIRKEEVLKAVDADTKIIFVCSPNNPTGNSVKREDVIHLLKNFSGIVVVDEAYIDFAPDKTFLPLLPEYPNLVVLQTLSKAWGLAGIRLGMAYGSEELIAILNKIKYPYNISAPAQQLALDGLKNLLNKEEMVAEILTERVKLKEELEKLPSILKVYPSDANFLLVKTKDGDAFYNYLIGKKIITRNRSRVPLCENTVRITVGTPQENAKLIEALREFKN